MHRRAFSVLELLVVVAIIAVLVALTFPMAALMRARAERIQCTSNLRNLYIATNLYLQQNEHWPQIETGDDDSELAAVDFGLGWIEALRSFGISEKTWVCPTIQKLLGNPDYFKPEGARVDYVATPFDDKPTTPHQWPTQPWFAESGDVHGSGNLIIFTDGSASDLKKLLKNQNQ